MQPSEVVMNWVSDAVGPGAEVLTVQGMHDGSGPWLLRIEQQGTTREVVLRVARQRNSIGPQPIATGAAALRFAEQQGILAPRLIAADLDGSVTGAATTLETYLPGSSELPTTVSPAQLRSAGAAIAKVHAIPLAPRPPDLPYRRWTMAPSDPAGARRWAALYQISSDDEKEAVLRAWCEATGESIERARRAVSVPRSTPLLHLADELIREHGKPSELTVFVHGDVWWGNTRWDGDHCFALIDWKDSGAGSPGVDLGNLRLDMAITYGTDTPDHVLDGWERETGRHASNIAYWDVIAALNSPAVRKRSCIRGWRAGRAVDHRQAARRVPPRSHRQAVMQAVRGCCCRAVFRADRRSWAALRRKVFHDPPTERNRVWQTDFSEFETAGGGIWRICAVIDYATKYCLAARITPTGRGVDALACLDAAVDEAERVLGPGRPKGRPWRARTGRRGHRRGHRRRARSDWLPRLGGSRTRPQTPTCPACRGTTCGRCPTRRVGVDRRASAFIR